MPYGCLNSRTLCAASRKALELSLEQWQRSMQIYKPKTFLVLASHENGAGTELELKREIVARSLNDSELSSNVIVVRAKNEEELAARIARHKTLMPIQTLMVFAESRHSVGLRPIFKRKFGNTLRMKKFKAEFEFNHPWIATSSSLTWFFRNLTLGVWLRMRKRMGRRLRKRLRELFWS